MAPRWATRISVAMLFASPMFCFLMVVGCFVTARDGRPWQFTADAVLAVLLVLGFQHDVRWLQRDARVRGFIDGVESTQKIYEEHVMKVVDAADEGA